MDKLVLAVFVAVAVAYFAIPVDADACSSRNSSCSECVGKFECYWCPGNKNANKSVCATRKVYQLLVSCSTSYHLYPSCAISGLAVMILVIVAIVLFVVIIVTCICCCCCCSNKRSKRKWLKEDERERRERDERKQRQEGRKMERKARNDEIRKKYGLYREGEGTEGRYQRFDT